MREPPRTNGCRDMELGDFISLRRNHATVGWSSVGHRERNNRDGIHARAGHGRWPGCHRNACNAIRIHDWIYMSDAVSKKGARGPCPSAIMAQARLEFNAPTGKRAHFNTILPTRCTRR